MATFFVGQLVRIVSTRNPIYERLVGRETRIIGVVPSGICAGEWVLEVGVSTSSDFIEPVRYDGAAPAEWSECLWQPKPKEVSA